MGYYGLLAESSNGYTVYGVHSARTLREAVRYFKEQHGYMTAPSRNRMIVISLEGKVVAYNGEWKW